ncbi:hypothetical protein EJB05_19792, partial [Eragrostis curvula]
MQARSGRHHMAAHPLWANRAINPAPRAPLRPQANRASKQRGRDAQSQLASHESSQPARSPFFLASVPFRFTRVSMEMKKIFCAVLVAASATVALAAEAPAPAPTSGSSAVAPAVLGAAVASFFAYYLQ